MDRCINLVVYTGHKNNYRMIELLHKDKAIKHVI